MPDDVVIIAAIKGLRMGQCASHFAREPPSTVSELYEVMQKFCKSDDDHRKRVEEENNFCTQIKNNNFNNARANNFERRPNNAFHQVNQIDSENATMTESNFQHRSQTFNRGGPNQRGPFQQVEPSKIQFCLTILCHEVQKPSHLLQLPFAFPFAK